MPSDMPCTDQPVRRPLTLTQVDWSKDLERWIVSARVGENWTLVGLFELAEEAFRAAERAAGTLGEGAR